MIVEKRIATGGVGAGFPRSSPTARLSRPTLGLMAACLLGLGLRLWGLGQRGFWMDELTSLGIAAQRLPDFRVALAVEANMTLYYWALFAWLRIVGLGADEALIRLPSALAGAAALPLVYLLGRRLHSASAGLWAAGLLAVNGFHLQLSQEARGYALLATLVVLSYLLFERALAGGRKRDWVLHGLVNGLAFYTHFFVAFVFVAQGLVVLSRRSRAALFGLALSGLVTAALALQFVPFLLDPPGTKLNHVPPLTWADVSDLFTAFSGGSGATLLLYVLLGAAGCWRARGIVDRRAGLRNWLLLAWFWVPVGLVLGLSLVQPIYKDRYLFAALPALPLLAGVGLARLPRPAAGLAFGGLAALSLLVTRGGIDPPREQPARALASFVSGGDFAVRRTEQWREAAGYLTSNARPGDGWIFVSKFGQNGLEYYARWRWGRDPAAPYRDVFEPFDWRTAQRSAEYRGIESMAALGPFAATHPRIWLVLSHEFTGPTGADTAEPVRSWLNRRGYGATQRQYRSVRVMLYRREGG